jgi:hypothetical protein
MEFTQYFLHTWKRPDRKGIRREWLEAAIAAPEHSEVQTDGRRRYWYWVEEERKYLRVVVLPDGETVHNAFFDRSFKGKQR